MFQRQLLLLLFLLLVSICNGFRHVILSSCKECYKTLDSPPEPTTEEAETLLSRCWAICVDKLPEYCPSCSLVPSFQSSQWSSLNYYEIRNCTMYQKLADCQRGCTLAHSNRSSTPDTASCTNQCISQCPNASKYDSVDCSVSCDDLCCESGCRAYSETNDSLSLPLPLEEPKLTSTTTLIGEDGTQREDGGRFVYNFMIDQSSMESSGDGMIRQTRMTTFVFKIKFKNKTHFISKRTSTGILNIRYLSCEENVHISYKAVMHDSTSNYSEETIVNVDGSKELLGYPEQVMGWPPESIHDQSIDTYFEDDLREGYTGHAVSYFSWIKPNNSQFISHYQLRLLSQESDCGGVHVLYEYCIDRDATSMIIEAINNTHPLMFDCTYLATLIVYPQIPGIATQQQAIRVKPVSDPVAPKLFCQREFQPDGTMTLYATWDASYDEKLFEAMESFVVTLQLFDNLTQNIIVTEIYEPEYIRPKINETIYVYQARNKRVVNDHDQLYRILVTSISNNRFPWRKMPPRSVCYLHTLAVEPDAINSSTIEIRKLEFTNANLFLNLSWEPSLAPNGRVTKYMVRIARNSLLPSESDSPTDYSYKHATDGTETEAVVNTSEIYQIDKVSCLYLQIRLMNDFLWSNWTKPVLLYKYPDNPFCDFTPTIGVTIDTTIEPAEQRPVGTIVGGVFGGLFGFVLLSLFCTGIFILCRRYRRRNRYLEAFKDDVNSNALYIRGPMSPAVVFPPKSLDSPRLDEWEIPANLVVVEKRLGEGCFGEVFQGVVKGPINNSKVQASFKNAICPVVAIKLLKSTASGSEKMDFLQEIETMKCVAKGNNPHVVNMIGCVTIQEPLCLITEFVKHGDLLSYLQSIRKMIAYRQNQASNSAKTGSKASDPNPYMIPSLEVDSPSRKSVVSVPDGPYSELGEIDSVNLLSFAYQIASGMEFLASLGIVHRDLACRNILVDDGKSLKISDFGMSRLVAANDVYIKNTRGRMPWKWMAIESITNREFTTASDVWAYGVTLWEIATLGGFPYPTITNSELLEHLQKGIRLEKPENCSEDVYKIMLECWKSDPSERLSFTALRAKFDSLISGQQGHVPYIDLDIDDCKPYYTTIDSDSEEKQASSDAGTLTSIDSISPLPREISSTRFDVIRPMLDSSSEGLPRPIENPYVDTPTKTKPHEVRLDEDHDVFESPLKKGGGGGGCMAEVA